MSAVPEQLFGETPEDAAHRTIPFDHTLRFEIKPEHQDGELLQGRIQISVEATYVALGIGYGFVAAEATKDFGPPRPAPPNLLLAAAAVAAPPDTLADAFSVLARALASEPRGDLTLATVLRNGVRIHPKYAAQLLPRGGAPFSFAVLGNPLPKDLFQAIVPAPAELQFLYAIHDQGSGRIFQSDPVLSTAGLGSPDGRRPFRQFAAPVRLAPRTTLRVDLTLIRPVVGELHFSLHGYKVLGTPGTPTDSARVARRTNLGARR